MWKVLLFRAANSVSQKLFPFMKKAEKQGSLHTHLKPKISSLFLSTKVPIYNIKTKVSPFCLDYKRFVSEWHTSMSSCHFFMPQ